MILHYLMTIVILSAAMRWHRHLHDPAGIAPPRQDRPTLTLPARWSPLRVHHENVTERPDRRSD
jgi:hypothetical protein